METVEEVPKRHINLKKYLSIFLVLILFLGLGGGIYLWQHRQVSNLNTQVAKLNSQIKGLNGTIKTLNNTVSNQKKATESPGAQPTSTKTAPDYNDGNFVALAPNSGLLTHTNDTVFEWTPHRLATIYTVEIKFMGQQSYPSSEPADQTVTFADTSSQPSKITLEKNIPDGDYNWRVTAKAIIDGKDTVLQSTPDWNYQIHTY